MKIEMCINHKEVYDIPTGSPAEALTLSIEYFKRELEQTGSFYFKASEVV